jgi:hypothetical protein
MSVRASAPAVAAAIAAAGLALGCGDQGLASASSAGSGAGGAASIAGSVAASSGTGGASASSSTGDGGSLADGGDGGVLGCDPSAPPSRFISCVLFFQPGAGAGFGQGKFPEIIYGPPDGAGTMQGSTDVLTLGGGGVIGVGFGGNAIVDGPGVDFIVFENPFDVGGDPDDPYAEPGVVGVSEDGVTWTEFPCDPSGYPYTGCAGVHPVLSNPQNGISPFDPTTAGGDPFDLADIGVTRARLLRIRDVSFKGSAPTEGFDLDAAAIVNPETP